MELRDCKFYYGGQEMSFAVFSDVPCRAKYLDSISIPLTQTRVDVYQIEPGVQTRWVLVKQKDGEKDQFKLFLRKGEKFFENRGLSRELQHEIFERFPRLSTEFYPELAA